MHVRHRHRQSTQSARSWPSQRCAGPSLDDLVGPHKEGLRDRQPKGLRGLQINDQLELSWLLDWEIGGLGAFVGLVHVGGGAPQKISTGWVLSPKGPAIRKR